MKRGLSIRYKFLLVTTALLVFCVVVYLSMATQVFRNDKTQLVYDLNRSLVNNLASDLDSMFLAATDKMRLAAYFNYAQDEKNIQILKEVISASPDIVYVGGSEDFARLGREFFKNEDFATTYALPSDYFASVLLEQKPVPFNALQVEGEAIWNATVENGPPLIGYGKSVVIEDKKGRPAAHYAVIAFLRADRILKSIERTRLSQALVTTTAGEVLVHPHKEMQLSGQDPSAQSLVKSAQEMAAKSSIAPYHYQGQEYLGAFARSANNRILVLSRVSSEAAFAVVNQFLTRSGLVALMVLNLAFIAAILFARSLTQPLQALMSGMERVGEGELSTQIHVNSKDEIAALAESFNGMIRELKQSREALEEINRELENKVRERTQQLEKQNQAVKSAQEALLRTTRLAAVGEIAGRAAHEVLNPLTTILARLERQQSRLGNERLAELEWLKDLLHQWREDFNKGGFSQLIKVWQQASTVKSGSSLWDEDLDNLEALQKNVQEELKRLNEDGSFLHKEAQRIARIVQAMRGLSVVEAIQKEHDLNILVEEVANIMRDLASQHQIEIVLTKHPEKATAVVDRDEFLQAMTNLVRNSIHATSLMKANASAVIRLDIRAKENQWQIHVIDQGIGISPENQAHLFESQFTTKDPGEGTGLGLNISRRFMRAVGGDIYLSRSKLNEGTEFVVVLPMKSNQPERGAA